MKLKPDMEMQNLLANNTRQKCWSVWGTEPATLKTIKATNTHRYSAAQKPVSYPSSWAPWMCNEQIFSLVLHTLEFVSIHRTDCLEMWLNCIWSMTMLWPGVWKLHLQVQFGSKARSLMQWTLTAKGHFATQANCDHYAWKHSSWELNTEL